MGSKRTGNGLGDSRRGNLELEIDRCLASEFDPNGDTPAPSDFIDPSCRLRTVGAFNIPNGTLFGREKGAVNKLSWKPGETKWREPLLCNER